MSFHELLYLVTKLRINLKCKAVSSKLCPFSKNSLITKIVFLRKNRCLPLLMSKAWVIKIQFQTETLNTISNEISCHFMQPISSYLVKISVNVVNCCTFITWYKLVIDNCFCDGQSSKENNSKSINDRVTFLALMLVDICIKFCE